MTTRLPVVFVSHGAPDALLKAPDAVACWQGIGQSFPRPEGILVISAHWEARRPSVSVAAHPTTIYDFSGFSPQLYNLKYPAPGALALAEQVVTLLSTIGLQTDLVPNRGLDHGAWVPLTAMYPLADIPVTQLSLTHHMNASEHYQLGRALAPLRNQCILILGSGAITHNFGWLNWQANGEQAPYPKANEFSEWVANRILTKDTSAIFDYRSVPFGAESHPTEEHFMPLFVTLGAADSDQPLRFHPNFAYGALSMDAYLWGQPRNNALSEKIND